MALILPTLIIHILNSFLLTYTTKKVFQLEKNGLFILILSISLVFLFLFDMAITCILLYILLLFYIFIEKRKWKFIDLIMLGLLVIAFLLSDLLAVSFCSFINPNNQSSSLFISITSTYFLGVSCYFLLLLKKAPIKHKHWIYMPFIMICMLLLLTLGQALVTQNPTMNLVYALMIEVIFLCACGLWIFYFVNKQIKENQSISKKLAKDELQKNLYNLTQRSMNQISSDKHMMIYTLMKIKQMISNQTNSALNEFVDTELGKYTNYKPITSTGNPLFDYEMTNKINLITSRHIEVKTFMTINEKNPILQEESVVYYLLSCIDHLIGFDLPICEIHFFFNEINSAYLKVRIVLTYPNETSQNYKLEQHPLLKKYHVIHGGNYDEFIFLFHTRT